MIHVTRFYYDDIKISVLFTVSGKQYSALDFIACACMSFGLICFTLADSTVSPSFNLFGMHLMNVKKRI